MDAGQWSDSFQTEQHLLHHHRMSLNDLFARLNPGGDFCLTRLFFSADKWLTLVHLVSQVIVLFHFVLWILRETSMGTGIFHVSGAEIKADDELSHKKLPFPWSPHKPLNTSTTEQHVGNELSFKASSVRLGPHLWAWRLTYAWLSWHYRTYVWMNG